VKSEEAPSPTTRHTGAAELYPSIPRAYINLSSFTPLWLSQNPPTHCPLGATLPRNMSSTASQRALDYLEALPGTTFTKLYQQPSTALAIFRRMLPHLAKTIVMAMLYMPTPFPTADLDSWIKPDSESLKARDQALDILRRLKVLFDTQQESGGGPAYKLSDAFARSLRLALTGGGEHRSFGVPCATRDEKPVTIEYLDTFARRQWEAILYYVVGSANAGLGAEVDISEGTKRLLQNGEFVAIKGRQAVITQAGFTFLLQEINAQIWSLLIVYLEVSSSVSYSLDTMAFLASTNTSVNSSKWTPSMSSPSSSPSAPSNSASATAPPTSPPHRPIC